MAPSTFFRGVAENSSFLCFRAIFLSYWPLFWGSVEIYKEYDSLCILESHAKTLVIFCVYGRYCELLPIVLGLPGWFTRPMTLSTCLRGWPKTRHFLRLWPFSWAMAHSFGVPGWFTKSMTLSMFLRGVTKNSSVLHFWAVFMSYCPVFWGSGVIYKVHDT
jgi:hypothetical protein